MSRRQRKKTSTRNREKKQGRAKLRGLWWKLLLGFACLLIAGSIFAYNRAIAFLHSDAFREEISLQVGAEVGSVVTFGDFKWDGLSAKNSSFKSTGEGAISSVDAEDISLDVKLDYIKRDKFRLKNVRIAKVNAVIDLRKDFLKFDKVEKEKSFLESLLPEEAELIDADVDDINATFHTDSGDYLISGVRLQTEKNDDSYNAIIKGGIVDLPFPFLRTATLEQGEIVQLDEEIYVKDTKFRIFQSGILTLNGDIDLALRARHLYDMKGELSGLRCKDVFPDSWHRHLTGEVEGKFSIKPYRGTEPKIVGRLEIKNGTLQALPILNQIAISLAEPKYRTLKFQKFGCDFEKFRDQIHLRNIVLTSDQLITIEGDLKIDGIKLDGLFDVGIPGSYLDAIPAAKNNVFLPGKNQLYWTKVKIGGDFDNITEDLKDRLISAFTKETIDRLLSIGGDTFSPETVEKLQLGSEGLLKNLNGVLNGEKGVIDGGVDAAKGLLEGITGAGTNNKKDEEKNGEEKDKEKDDKIKEGGGLIPEIPKLPEIDKLLPFL